MPEVNETNLHEARTREALLSSQMRLHIAALISTRPRSLRELAALTRLSVPGVLRHIEAMSKFGLVREERVRTKTLPVRKLYSLKGARVMDFSVGDLTILKIATSRAAKRRGALDLETKAVDMLVSRRRIREKARRLAKTIDELVEDEESLRRGIDDLKLTDEERIVILTMYTEETGEDAERVLAQIQGMKDARRSIESALSKARRSV